MSRIIQPVPPLRIRAKQAQTTPTPSTATDATQAAPPALTQIIRPSVRDRWTSVTLQGLTPDLIDQTLRGALSGNLIYQWQLFDLMEDTWPQLQKNLNELKRAVSKVDFTSMPFSLPGAKPSKRAIEKSEFLHRIKDACTPDITLDENSFKRAVESLCDALPKGISVQEILWAQRPWQGQMEIVPRAFQWVHPRHYGYPFTSDMVDRLMLSVTGLTLPDTVFPPDQFLIGIFKSKEGHPIGGAMLRCLAALWLGRNFAFDWALNLAQVFGLPIRWATYDATKPHLLDDLTEMLANMGSCGWAAFPSGTTFELKEAAKNAERNPQDKIMEIADTACDLLILGQSETSSNKNGGSNAKAQVHFAVRADVIEYVAGWVTDILNPQFVAPLMRLNFGDNEEDPKLVAEVEMPKDALAMIERDQIVLEMGVPVAEEWFYARHEIPRPGPEDVVLKVNPTQAPGKPVTPPNETTVDARRVVAKAAQAPQQRLAATIAEQLTGVAEEALSPVLPVFRELVAMASNDKVTDEQLVAAMQKAADAMPELFPRVLQAAAGARELLEAGMGAASLNGALAAPTVKGGKP